eukprot:g2952.t1
MSKPDFTGYWICKEMVGLEDFMKYVRKDSWIKTKLAQVAGYVKTQYYDITQYGDEIVCIESVGLSGGVKRNRIHMHGKEQDYYDGDSEVVITASWDDEKLVIQATSRETKWKSTRWMEDDGETLINVLIRVGYEEYPVKRIFYRDGPPQRNWDDDNEEKSSYEGKSSSSHGKK